MCGRIGLPKLTWAQFHAWLSGNFDWDEFHRINDAKMSGPSWNVKPTQQVDIVFDGKEGKASAPARWWFVPHWFKGDPKDWKQTTFNARIETADQKPTFRTAWTHGRCVIPVTGYYEWTGSKGSKQPHWITAQTNMPCLFFAGLYSKLATGLYTCTILTRAALPQIEHIHARTPVLLNSDDVSLWLSGEMSTTEAQNALGTGWNGRMIHHEVKPFKRDDDGPELIEPMLARN